MFRWSVWKEHVQQSSLSWYVCSCVLYESVWHRAGLTGRAWHQFYWMWLGTAPGFTAPHFYSVYPLWKKKRGRNEWWMNECALFSFSPLPFPLVKLLPCLPTFLCPFSLPFSRLLSSSFSFVLMLSRSSTWEFFCSPVWTSRGAAGQRPHTQKKGGRGKEEQRGVKETQ